MTVILAYEQGLVYVKIFAVLIFTGSSMSTLTAKFKGCLYLLTWVQGEPKECTVPLSKDLNSFYNISYKKQFCFTCTEREMGVSFFPGCMSSCLSYNAQKNEESASKSPTTGRAICFEPLS